MSKNKDVKMVKNCAEILETKEIFTLNLDDYSDINDFDNSKGILWDFKHYLSRNEDLFSKILGIDKDSVTELCNKNIQDDRLTIILHNIIGNL